jgi:hypothetical protein
MEIQNVGHKAERHHDGVAAERGKTVHQHEGGEVVGLRERARRDMNMAILKSASEVTLSSGNQPLHLLYRSAIDSLNKILAPELGDGAIERAAENPDEFTPENTAERITSFALSFYSAYQRQHPEMQEEESVNSFISLMTGAVERGINEARDILDGLGVLEGEIGENIDKTLELIQGRFDTFRKFMLGNNKSGEDSMILDRASIED